MYKINRELFRQQRTTKTNPGLRKNCVKKILKSDVKMKTLLLMFGYIVSL
jgi:hypothetical protein